MRWLLVALCLGAQSLAQVTATIPNGRRITPVGDWITVAPFPFSLAIRPDGKQLVAPSLGFPFALNIIEPDRKVTQIPSGFLSKPDVQVYAGGAYSPDGKKFYVATGDSGAIEVLATSDWHRLARIRLSRDSFAAALLLSRNGGGFT